MEGIYNFLRRIFGEGKLILHDVFGAIQYKAMRLLIAAGS